MKLAEIFKVVQGHQITDEEIYNSPGDIPIYTGNNDLKGFWNKTIIDESMLPCLTYPTKAFSGKLFIQDKPFDANNTACLLLKDEYKDKVLLEYFQYLLPSEFLKNATSKEGVSYLNKEIVENIDIDLPEKKQQEKLITKFKAINFYNESIQEMRMKLLKSLEKEVIVDFSYDEEVNLNKVLGYVSRNDSLSEEGIYINSNRNYDGEYITVLSGNSNANEYGRIPINTKGIHFIENRQILHLVTRGNAGKLTYMPKGNYATNTNAFILYLKEESFNILNIQTEDDEEIYLKFLRILLQPKFYSVSSNADVAIFPLTDVIKTMTIPLYKFNKNIINLVNSYDMIEKFYYELSDATDLMRDIENRQIVFE